MKEDVEGGNMLIIAIILWEICVIRKKSVFLYTETIESFNPYNISINHLNIYDYGKVRL